MERHSAFASRRAWAWGERREVRASVLGGGEWSEVKFG
jgi:hypothetical protein